MLTGILAGALAALLFWGPIIGGVNAIFDASRNIHVVVDWEKQKAADARKACRNHPSLQKRGVCGDKK